MPTDLSVEDLLDAYRTMKTIREFEDRVHVEFAKGGIPGFVHLYAGEEASATGICMHLKETDAIASNHRGHGHCTLRSQREHAHVGAKAKVVKHRFNRLQVNLPSGTFL